HETKIRIARATNDRLIAYVERRVEDDGATGLCLKCRDHCIEVRFVVGMDRLDSGAVVDVGHGRQIRSDHARRTNDLLVFIPQGCLLQRRSSLGPNIRNESHIGTLAIEFEIASYAIVQNGGSKWTE